MSRVTRNSGKGYRHNRRSRPQHQIDLFRSGLSNDASGAPAWPELPAEARAALTNEPDDAVDPRPCCDDSDAAREGG